MKSKKENETDLELSMMSFNRFSKSNNNFEFDRLHKEVLLAFR